MDLQETAKINPSFVMCCGLFLKVQPGVPREMGRGCYYLITCKVLFRKNALFFNEH
jgi:hypothetical protein